MSEKKSPHVYENSEIFLRRTSDPFGPEFEDAISDVPSLPVKRQTQQRSTSLDQSALSQTSSSPRTSLKKPAYDEVSLNAGRPVIVTANLKVGDNDNSLTAVSFRSPTADVSVSPTFRPIPAPRFSKLKDNHSAQSSEEKKNEEDKNDDETSVIYEELKPKLKIDDELYEKRQKPRPTVPPRNKYFADEDKGEEEGTVNIYSELDTTHEEEEEDDFLAELDSRSRPIKASTRATTIDIRKDVNKLWDEAVKELQQDQNLVEYILNHEAKGNENKRILLQKSSNNNTYHSVAIPQQTFQIVDGVQVPIAGTVLRNFDPCFELEKKESANKSEEGSLSDNQSSGSGEEETWSATSKETLSCSDKSSKHSGWSNSEFRISDCSGFDVPPPNIPPPPVPTTEPLVSKHAYENVWVSPQENDSPASFEPRGRVFLESTRRSFTVENEYSAEGATATSFSSYKKRDVDASWNSNVGESASVTISHIQTESSPDSSPLKPVSSFSDLKQTQRSASTSNLSSFIAKKFSFNKIGRRVSDQVKEPNLEDFSATKGMRRRSSALESQISGTINYSGPLYVFKTVKRSALKEKWCVLGNANLRFFDHQDSLAEPKRLILLKDILTLSKHTETDPTGELFLFCVSYLSKPEKGQKPKLVNLYFGTYNLSVRRSWISKIARSMSPQLSIFDIEKCNRFGWCYLKVMFAGEWALSWVDIVGNDINYSIQNERICEKVDLKKTKNLTLVKEIGNLKAPHSSPVLVIDFVDRSLYLQTIHEDESLRWKTAVEEIAYNNGMRLDEQQLTKDNIPVVVEQCVNFVFRHGCMTEGIYRHSGVKTKIDRLLKEFRANVWAVPMTREEFSEHDVANALKRFLRTLQEPLLTKRLRSEWMEASKIYTKSERIAKYEDLLGQLPAINYRTLRRLIGHLRTIANQCDRNLMPNYNLAAIWGPTLLTVDGESVSNFAQTTGEADVCRDLIDNYMGLFKVTDKEIEREEEIIKKTESFNRNPNPVKLSGEVMMFVYIDTKSGGDCVSIAVTPKMTAHELQKRTLRKANYKGDSSGFLLHEVVLNGELERPIHYNECIYEVTLKWWKWDEEDRRDTYLLLKRNIFWEESVPYTSPALSVFGEALFSDNTKTSKGQFKKFLFSMSNAKLTRSKEQKNGDALVLESYDIEKIIWYFGCESKRHPPSNFNITFLDKLDMTERTKERPFFGKTISFASRDLFIKWIAAMIVAEHQNNIHPPVETLLNIDED